MYKNDYLVFGDCHVEPGDNLNRFKWLGKEIVNRKPKYIVQLGDFVSMLALSHWDKHKKLLMEGRRVYDDMDVGIHALYLMLNPLTDLQIRQKRNKQKVYSPTLVWCDGNHEEWVIRYIEENPQLEGHLLPFFEEAKRVFSGFSEIIYVPYKSYTVINNIAFTHVPIGANGQPISGKYAHERALDLFATDVVYGHTHRFIHAHRYQHGMGLKQAINAGCFFSKTPDYAWGAANEHFRGILLINHRNDGLLNVRSRSWM